jgi:hypothetical protein
MNYPHGDTTGGRIGSDKPVDVRLHSVILNKVISYLILYKINFPLGILHVVLCMVLYTMVIGCQCGGNRGTD